MTSPSPSAPYKFSWEDIQTIFQMENPAIYKPVTETLPLRYMIGCVHELASYAGSPTQDFFANRLNLDNIQCQVVSSDDNYFAISVHHSESNPNSGEAEEWHTFVMGHQMEIPDNDSEETIYQFDTLYILSGQVVDNGQNFIVKDLICRKSPIPHSGEIDWAMAENEADLKAMLVYGYNALSTIVNGDEAIDISDLQADLDPTQYNLDEEFDFICGRQLPPVENEPSLSESFKEGLANQPPSRHKNIGGRVFYPSTHAWIERHFN